jgi:ABC-2 type transport system ATP-binding protein
VIIDHGKVIASGTMSELVQQTVGLHRLVTLRLDAPLGVDAARSIAGDGETLTADAVDPRIVKARLSDVGAELPPLLERIRLAGRLVDDIEVRGPSLQSVFIHLTGRELRE